MKKGVKYGNTYYFYNEKNNSVSVLNEKLYDITACPDYVISAFINKNYDTTLINKKSKSTEFLTDNEINQLMNSINNTEEIKE